MSQPGNEVTEGRIKDQETVLDAELEYGGEVVEGDAVIVKEVEATVVELVEVEAKEAGMVNGGPLSG
jgi:hypothetical protein